jgi:hypothetical protein
MLVRTESKDLELDSIEWASDQDPEMNIAVRTCVQR